MPGRSDCLNHGESAALRASLSGWYRTPSQEEPAEGCEQERRTRLGNGFVDLDFTDGGKDACRKRFAAIGSFQRGGIRTSAGRVLTDRNRGARAIEDVPVRVDGVIRGDAVNVHDWGAPGEGDQRPA